MDAASRTARRELTDRWPIALAAFLGIAGGVSALPYYTQGLFVGPLTHDFGWSREQMSLVTLIGAMLLAGFSPLVGTLVDRVGVIYPLVASFCALVAGYLALSMIGGSFAVFLLLQMALIAIGSATGPVSFTRIINEHFAAARGLTLGIALSGAGVMAIIAPPLIAALIAEHSWRAGYLLIAGLIAGSAACSVLLLRYRMPPPAPPVAVAAVAAAVDDDAVRQPATLVWRLAVTFLLMALGVGGFTFHLVPMLVDAGMDLPAASRIQSLIGVALLVGRLGAGTLMDRIFAPFVAAGIVCLAALGIVGIALFGVVAAAPCALLIGLALGAEGDVIGYLTARYFGMAAYGRIYGQLYGIFAFGLGLSPVLISRLQAMAATYQTSLWLSAAVLLAAAVSLLALPRFPTGSHHVTA